MVERNKIMPACNKFGFVVVELCRIMPVYIDNLSNEHVVYKMKKTLYTMYVNALATPKVDIQNEGGIHNSYIPPPQ